MKFKNNIFWCVSVGAILSCSAQAAIENDHIRYSAAATSAANNDACALVAAEVVAQDLMKKVDDASELDLLNIESIQTVKYKKVYKLRFSVAGGGTQGTYTIHVNCSGSVKSRR